MLPRGGFGGMPPQRPPMGMEMMGNQMGNPIIPVQGRPLPPKGQVNQLDQQYSTEFQRIIGSQDYKSDDEDGKKTRIGDFIYNYIEKLSSADDAPKITGMIIDLDEKDLIESVRTYTGLKEKVDEGKNLLAQEDD